MKETLIAVVLAFMFTDTFFMLCLLRASALYEQREKDAMEYLDTTDKIS